MTGNAKRILSVLLLAAVATFCGVVVVQPAAAAQPSVERGAEALGDVKNIPWYDLENDSLRKIDVRPSDPPPNPSDKNARTRNATNNTPLATPGFSAGFSRFMQWLGWTVIAVVLVLLVWAAVRAWVRRETAQFVATSDENVQHTGEADRIESLPFRVRRPQSDLLAEARRHYDEGNFGEAIIYLFSYQLVELDKNQIIRLARGKTNRQYLREAQRRGPLAALLQQTMIAFEDVFFGNHRLERRRFEACWNQLDQFEQQLRQAGA